MVALYLLIAVVLVLLNGFFVLAEFAAVKMRPSRVRELQNDGVRWAEAAGHVQEHLDEYLSVCQVGITFTSIGLGFVAEPAVVRLVEPGLRWTGLFSEDSSAKFFTSHGIAFAISYLLVSYFHILIGELVQSRWQFAERIVGLWPQPLRCDSFELCSYCRSGSLMAPPTSLSVSWGSDDSIIQRLIVKTSSASFSTSHSPRGS